MQEPTQATDQPIVVVGLGPIGLAMTLESLKKGKGRKVIAITDRNRNAYTRGQLFRLDQHTIDYLSELIGDAPISALYNAEKLQKIADPNGDYFIIQAMSLEKMLYDSLAPYGPEQLEIIYTPKGGPAEVTRVDTQNHSLEISTGATKRIIPFKYLIGADGGQHNTSDQLNKDFANRADLPKAEAKAYQNVYETTQREQTHSFHATAIFSLPAGATRAYQAALRERKNTHPPSMGQLREEGWELNSTPESRVFALNNKLYIGTEVPKSIFQLPPSPEKSKKINEWAKMVLGFHLPEENLNKIQPKQYKETAKGRKKAALQTTIFEVKLEEAGRTVLPLLPQNTNQQTAYFFQAGDSLRKPHYHTGTGTIVGFLEAEQYGLFLESDQSVTSLQNYHINISDIRASNRQKVDEYLEGRAQREKIATEESLTPVAKKLALLEIIETSSSRLINYLESRQARLVSTNIFTYFSHNKGLTKARYNEAQGLLENLQKLEQEIDANLENEDEKVEDYANRLSTLLSETEENDLSLAIKFHKNSKSDLARSDFRKILTATDDQIERFKQETHFHIEEKFLMQ